jgi:hypothetical protein
LLDKVTAWAEFQKGTSGTRSLKHHLGFRYWFAVLVFGWPEYFDLQAIIHS